MSIEQAKEIVQALSSLYPLKDYEEEAIQIMMNERSNAIDECIEAIKNEKDDILLFDGILIWDDDYELGKFTECNYCIAILEELKEKKNENKN